MPSRIDPRKRTAAHIPPVDNRGRPVTVPGTAPPVLKRPKPESKAEIRMDTDYDPDPLPGRLPEKVRKEESSA